LTGSVLKLKKNNFFYSLLISQVGEISVADNLSYWLMTGIKKYTAVVTNGKSKRDTGTWEKTVFW
jgi:hypothetical protein